METKQKQNYLEWVNRLIRWLVRGKRFESDDDMYLYSVMFLSSVFFMVMSLSLVAISLYNGIMALAYANVIVFAGGLFFMYCFFVKKNSFAMGLYISLSVMAYTIFATLCIGARYYIFMYYLVILLMQTTVPYARLRTRMVIAAMVWLCLMATIFIGNNLPPLYEPTHGTMLLSLFNANVTFMGILMEITLGNFVREYLQQFNRERMREMQTRTVTDELTGLYNRRYAQSLPELLQQEHMIVDWCVAMADIDDFKRINDSLGHHTGDKVLQLVADTMKAALRKKDVIVRWGGEEFMILLAETELTAAVAILEKLRARVQEAYIEEQGQRVGCTVTIGVTQTDPFHFESAIQESDRKLYEGKRAGKNQVVA